MWIYIVVCTYLFRDENVKVFTSKEKADCYAKQQNKIAPYFNHRVETYWAE
jgi:hypothetical protein